MVGNGEVLEHPKIAMIGGGTGSFTLLQELKHFTPEISALVNMSDDGGSSGRLRDELGVLPPGDVRQCLVALSDAPEARDVFSYRFGDGPFAGHSLGNIILSGLELKYGDFAQATKVASHILRITGSVIPVTLENHTLVMNDGEHVVRGEHAIGHRKILQPDAAVFLDPPARLNPEAEAAIQQADLVVVAPGNLYGSLLPALVVDGMASALQSTKALRVMVSNLVTKPGQTDGWHVADYVKAMERYVGEGAIDVVLYNNAAPPQELLDKYAAEGEFPVGTSEERFAEVKAVPVGAALVARGIFIPDPKDRAIRRTLVRHDARWVGEELMRLHHG